MSTGGSATAIEAAGVPVKRVEELTGFPEMLDGANTDGWKHEHDLMPCCWMACKLGGGADGLPGMLDGALMMYVV